LVRPWGLRDVLKHTLAYALLLATVLSLSKRLLLGGSVVLLCPYAVGLHGWQGSLLLQALLDNVVLSVCYFGEPP
jgi:hypothetical protein